MDKELIDFAKKYALENNSSISSLIENYFRLIAQRHSTSGKSSMVNSLSGVISEKDLGTKTDYITYLEKKYR